MPPSEPSRVDRIKVGIKAHKQQIDALFEAMRRNQDLNTQILATIERLSVVVLGSGTHTKRTDELIEPLAASEERHEHLSDNLSHQRQQMLSQQQDWEKREREIEERHQEWAVWRQEMDQAKRKNDERFNILLAEIRLMNRRWQQGDT
ncbi:hypothetical protein BST81_21100 [Leptolyngbya sp. 'hensonii']|uniref:hypothetical protein n=1 Tax=Leptolyngbya sp. 'hensonii' TaxID=1922337 RepID=UPI00095000E6|nr:hypothetical protein [Leptolyngbya sp. 'hensonii']OLP16478.1 hypothetical protein BST81_21100 [Leptolyngbya sp. 'hensonii']